MQPEDGIQRRHCGLLLLLTTRHYAVGAEDEEVFEGKGTLTEWDGKCGRVCLE